jgi:hypothetical protein
LPLFPFSSIELPLKIPKQLLITFVSPKLTHQLLSTITDFSFGNGIVLPALDGGLRKTYRSTIMGCRHGVPGHAVDAVAGSVIDGEYPSTGQLGQVSLSKRPVHFLAYPGSSCIFLHYCGRAS